MSKLQSVELIDSLTENADEWERMLNKKYSLRDSCFQFYTNDNADVLGDFSACLVKKLTLDELKMICEEIAAFVGGELYGTVNIDFFGSRYSFEMMIEWQAKKRGRRSSISKG